MQYVSNVGFSIMTFHIAPLLRSKQERLALMFAVLYVNLRVIQWYAATDQNYLCTRGRESMQLRLRPTLDLVGKG
jgi:hypothetical protein